MLTAASQCARAVAGGSHERFIGKECLHDCEPNLSAAYGKVIAAIAGGCVNCAARREAISEVMRVHQRVLRTLRPVLITSPEDQTACLETWGT
jgi:hypothetical protein